MWMEKFLDGSTWMKEKSIISLLPALLKNIYWKKVASRSMILQLLPCTLGSRKVGGAEALKILIEPITEKEF